MRYNNNMSLFVQVTIHQLTDPMLNLTDLSDGHLP